jgi:hypothetical protein
MLRTGHCFPHLDWLYCRVQIPECNRRTPGVLVLILVLLLPACGPREPLSTDHQLAIRVRHDVQRCWDAYSRYAWGMDVLRPLSKTGHNWYGTSLGIAAVDGFPTLVVAGLTEEADRVVEFVADSLDFDKDQEVKVFEVNIRVLGGLVSMYQLSGDERILARAVDVADRLMPAFASPTGIPYFSVNLRTGAVSGRQVNVAEAGTYLLEMGMISYFTGDPRYYRAAKASSRAIYSRRSELGLVGEVIDVETGEWINPSSHICAGTDSYYEYLFKGWLLFGDEELKTMWDESIAAVFNYIPEVREGRTWYGRVDMHSGERQSTVVTLWDAFMPALLALSGHLDEAAELQDTWDWLWNHAGIKPMIYDYAADSILNPAYALNPEIFESAYTLWELTGEERYLDMLRGYYADLMASCGTGEAYCGLKDVRSAEQHDYMDTYFVAETLKYLYLAFAGQDMYHPGSVVFSTEAHPYLKAALDPGLIRKNLELP